MAGELAADRADAAAHLAGVGGPGAPRSLAARTRAVGPEPRSDGVAEHPSARREMTTFAGNRQSHGLRQGADMSRGLGKVERQILEVLTQAGTGVEIRMLAGALDGLGDRHIRRAVQRLERQGRIEATFLRGHHEHHWGGMSRVKVVRLASPKGDVQDERPLYTSDDIPHDLPDVYRAHQGFDAHEYLTESELLVRGWTIYMVVDFLRNLPDLTLGFGAENRLYTRQRVLAAEARPEFQKRQRQREQRHARRRRPR